MAQPPRGAVTVEEAHTACIADGTRAPYKSNIRQILKWIKAAHHDPDRFVAADGNLDVAVFTPELFEEFALARFNDTKKPLQVPTISNYRSAVRHLHRLRRLPIPHEYSEDLKTTFSGLDRIENAGLQRGSTREVRQTTATLLRI